MLNNKVGLFLNKRAVLAIFLFFYFAFSILTYKHYGIGFDERNVYLRGKLLYTKIKGNDQVLQRDFVIKNKTNSNLTFYNNTYSAFLYVINGRESYEIYHLLNLLFASLVFIAIYEVLLKEFKKPKFAIIGPIFLFLTPFFTGQIAFNPKDVPFAILYFLSLTAIFLLNKNKNELIEILILGFLFGVTASSRSIGYTIYIVYFIFNILNVRKKGPDFFINLTLKLVIISLIGFLVQMVTVPYIGADPFNHFKEVLQISKSFPWKGQMLFFGKKILSTNLPWTYLPGWILVTTPIFILFFIFLSLRESLKKNKLHQLMIASLVINLITFYIVHPIIYNGYRHMLFLTPILVTLSSEGFVLFIRFFKFRFLKVITIGMVILNITIVIYNIKNLHPYEYSYFNELVGGTKRAYGKFELDWWGTSVKDAVLYLNKITKNKDKITVGIYGPGFPVDYYKNSNIILVSHDKPSDYTISWELFDDSKKIRGEDIFQVKREGVPLIHVFKTN